MSGLVAQAKLQLVEFSAIQNSAALVVMCINSAGSSFKTITCKNADIHFQQSLSSSLVQPDARSQELLLLSGTDHLNARLISPVKFRWQKEKLLSSDRLNITQNLCEGQSLNKWPTALRMEEQFVRIKQFMYVLYGLLLSWLCWRRRLWL